MMKYLLFVLLIASLLLAESRRQPLNIKFEVDTIYVAANEVDTSRMFDFAGAAWKIGKIAIVDTNIIGQDTIDIGAGVKIRQLICMHPGNIFGFAAADTLCTVCGDTTSSAFVGSEGLSSDSLIVSAIDTTQMELLPLGGQDPTSGAADSVQISTGYFVPITDPAPYIRFEVTGSATLGATKKAIIIMIWSFDGTPVKETR